jgi:hypothetical protein
MARQPQRLRRSRIEYRSLWHACSR